MAQYPKDRYRQLIVQFFLISHSAAPFSKSQGKLSGKDVTHKLSLNKMDVYYSSAFIASLLPAEYQSIHCLNMFKSALGKDGLYIWQVKKISTSGPNHDGYDLFFNL